MSGRAQFWAEVREALAGTERDYTHGPLTRAIILLAIPMVLEMCMESLFSITNIFWVARLGADSVAAVGVTESMMTIVYSVAMGVGMATTAMVARRIGEGDEPGAARSAGQSVLLGLALAASIGFFGVWKAADLLRYMGSEPGVVQAGESYTGIILGSSLSVMLLFLLNAVFRGAGDAAIAMRVLWAANLLNMALDPCLIYGLGPFPAMGVKGAAVATAFSRTFGVLLQIYAFSKGKSRIRLNLRDFAPDWPILHRLSRISATGMLQFLIAHASWLAMVRLIAGYGSVALAGYTIAIRIVIFSVLPSWGLANAAATLVGQNLGARQPDRAEQSVWQTGFYNMVFLTVTGLLFWLIPAPLVRLFTDDPSVVEYGAHCLRVVAVGYPFYGYGMVMVQAFNGAGDTTTPTIINLGCYWCIQIPTAWLLSQRLGWGSDGVFWAIPIAEALLTVVGLTVFRQGRWKLQEV